jgi:hypothetical protein
MRALPRNRTMVLIGLLLVAGLLPIQLNWGTIAEAAVKSEPVADAGDDFHVLVGRTVVLDGSRSFHPLGKKLKFKWKFLELPPGSSAKLHKANSATPSFTADKHGTYIIELLVHSGMKWSARDILTVTTTYPDYPENALVPVNTRPYTGYKNLPLEDYSIQVGEITFWAPPYQPGTETSTATGFQVLVLDRKSLQPAAIPYPWSYNQSFSSTLVGYTDMMTFLIFLESLADNGLLVIISSLNVVNDLDLYYAQREELAALIKYFGGTDNFERLADSPSSAYSLIGIPGVGEGNGFELCDWDFTYNTPSIQGVFVKDENHNFQFIYPDFTDFETKSGTDPEGYFVGSLIVGADVIDAPEDVKLSPNPEEGAFGALQLVSFSHRGGLEVAYNKAYLTNVRGQESESLKELVADLKSLAGFMFIIQSIGVPFGDKGLYDPQSIRDLENLINNLGGTESTFHAIFNNPGTVDNPNKYSLLGIAVDGFIPMTTMPRLGPTESVEASTLELKEDGSWSASDSDGNVRAVINKNKQGMYVPFLASKGAANVDLSLPIILFQDATPWITAPEGTVDDTPYVAAYKWISNYLYEKTPLKFPEGEDKPDDLRSSYPASDNLWETIRSTLWEDPIEQAVTEYIETHTDFNYEEYQFIQNQLNDEILDVEAVYTLFFGGNGVKEFLSDMQSYETFVMGDFYKNAYEDLGISPTTETTQNVLAIVRYVLDVASKALPLVLLEPEPVAAGPTLSINATQTAKPAGPILGIASATVSLTMAFLPGNSENPVAEQISTTIEELWTDLYTNYLKKEFLTQKSYELAVSDWGKLQGAEKLWGQWDTHYVVDAQKLMIAGFEASIYRILIPIAYQVERLLGTQVDTVVDFPICGKDIYGDCFFSEYHLYVPLPNYVALASQAWDPLQVRQANDLYWVYRGNHNWEVHFIPEETLNNIFAPFDPADEKMTKLGVSKVDFFTRWPFEYSDCPNNSHDDCYGCPDGVPDY